MRTKWKEKKRELDNFRFAICQPRQWVYRNFIRSTTTSEQESISISNNISMTINIHI